eukprot:g5624.t1
MDGRVLDPRTSGAAVPYFDIASMPHLEAMMSRGTTFVGHYCNNPLCAPSRASLFTGRRTSTIEAWSNVKALTVDVTDPTQADPACASVPGYTAEICVEMGKRQLPDGQVNGTLNHALSAAGYDVRLYGKMDTGGGPSMLPPGTHATGFHMPGGNDWSKAWGPGNPELTYYPADILHSWANSANISEAIFAALDAPNSWINHTSKTGCPSAHGDWMAISECVKFLKNWREGEDPPFALYCSVVDPHPPYWSNATWMRNVNRTALNATLRSGTARTWSALPLAEAHPNDRYAARSEGIPSQDALDLDLAYDMNVAYGGQLAETDAMMGAVLDALARSEAADNTFTLFTSDHGEHRLEHRRVEKMSHYEASARVPMIITGPGVARNKLVHNLTSLIDIFPTFLDWAGAPKPAFLEGYSLVPFLGALEGTTHATGFPDPAGPRPDFVTSEYTGEATNTGAYMIRRGPWKLIAYGRDPPYQDYASQLFNLDDDPMEVDNVAGEHPALVAELDRLLRSQIDYPKVNSMVIEEGRGHVKRWIALYNSTAGWRAEVEKAYGRFTEDDFGKFTRWLDQAGEYAPSSSGGPGQPRR